jgi:peptide/nickel transport system permease protein
LLNWDIPFSIRAFRVNDMALPAAIETLPVKRSPFENFWRTFSRNKMGLLGLTMLIGIILVAIFAPALAPFDPYSSKNITAREIYQPPSLVHPWGTDDAGKDELSLFVYGARVSLVVGFFASFISIAIGGSIGISAGFFGGRTENILMRFNDIMLVIPDLALMVVIIALTKPSLWNIILVIGLLGWTFTSRIVRSQTLAVKSKKYVLRARAIGAGNWHIVRTHIFPLVLPILVVNAVLVISIAILNESALSFLGLGDPTLISWGQMLNYAFARGAMSSGAWWALVVPGFGIVWVVLSLTLLGQGLEQVFNPRLETHHLTVNKKVVIPELVHTPNVASIRPLLGVDHLSIEYKINDQSAARAVDNVSFTLKKGEMLGMVGESGCGKTTLMLGLLRLLPASGRIVSGRIEFDGHDLISLAEDEIKDVRWKEISIIFQGAMNALNPVRTIGDQVAEAIRQHEVSVSQIEVNTRVDELLDLVGISPERREDYPHQYSGGMRQRAMIAMALACNPQIVIADEPTTALDVMIQAQILELLSALREKLGLSIIFVTHDLGVVAEMCDSVLVMYGGTLAEYAPVDQVYNSPQHPYTRELLKAFPDLANPEKKLSSIPGYPPRLDNLPNGCRFAPRCPQVFERCNLELPGIQDLGGNHYVGCHLLDKP